MPPTAPNSIARRFRVPGYLFFGIAFVLPLLDLLISVYPIRLGTVVWRFGAVGLLSSAIGAPLLVLFLIFVLAVICGDNKVITTVGVVAAIIALVLVAGTGSFALDALQMKRRVQEAAQQRFMLASGQAMLKMILQGISAIVLAITAFRMMKAPKVVAVSRTEPRRSASLVMGRKSGPTIAAPQEEAPPVAVTGTTEE